MITIRELSSKEKSRVNEIVSIHMETFTGFFLTFMGRGFLNQMYRAYCDHSESGLLVAEDNGRIVGFLAYSEDFGGLYKYMIKTRLLLFGWYSVGAFFRRPSSFFHILRAFLKPSEVKREEKYVELSSIGVEPDNKSMGVGTLLIKEFIKHVDFNKYAYITLETDVVDNENVIAFYEKNGFVRQRLFITAEGREMYEYRYMGE